MYLIRTGVAVKKTQIHTQMPIHHKNTTHNLKIHKYRIYDFLSRR